MGPQEANISQHRAPNHNINDQLSPKQRQVMGEAALQAPTLNPPSCRLEPPTSARREASQLEWRSLVPPDNALQIM